MRPCAQLKILIHPFSFETLVAKLVKKWGKFAPLEVIGTFGSLVTSLRIERVITS